VTSHTYRKPIMAVLTTATMLFFAFPFVWTLLISFGPDILGSASSFSLDNYVYVLGINGVDTNFLKSMQDTLVVGLGTMILAISLAVLASYAITRCKFRGSGLIAFGMLAFPMAPAVGLLLPIFVAFVVFGLYDTYGGLVLVYTAFQLPLIIWMLRGFFQGLPAQLEEAAMVDGCSRFSAFLRVVLPNMRPGLTATAILSFLLAWNEFLFPLALAGSNVTVLTVAMDEYLGKATIYYGRLGAAAVVGAIPGILFTALAGRELEKALTFGYVKG